MNIFNDRYEAVRWLKEVNKENRWYVYILSNKGVPFYVGVAKNNKRLYQHEKDAKPYAKKTNPLKVRKIRKINREGSGIDYTIVRFFYSVLEVQHAERSLILLYGRILDKNGTLTNILEGGDGSLGRPSSKKQREAVSKANKGKPKTEETISRLKASLADYYTENDSPWKGRKHSEETKLKMSEAHSGTNSVHYGTGGETHFNYGRKHSEETKLKISQVRNENPTPCSEERKQKLKEYWDNQPILTCPHCGKQSSFKASMIRHHFDKCKYKVNQPFEADTFANVKTID